MIFAALMTLWNAFKEFRWLARVRSSAATSASTVILSAHDGGAEDYFAAAFFAAWCT